jgi:ribonuclease E
VQIGKISRFGLMELSRQRLRPSLGETTHGPCPRCHGTGHIRGTESTALHILRIIQEEAMKENTGAINAQVPVDVATFLLNEKRVDIQLIETRHRVTVMLIPNVNLETPNYTVTRMRHDDLNKTEPLAPSYNLVAEPSEEDKKVQGKASETTAPRQEAAVRGITPQQPAPVPAAREAQPEQAQQAVPAVGGGDASIIGKIFGLFRRKSDAPAAAQTPPSSPEQGSSRGRHERSEREGGRRDRGERHGGQRHRDGQDRQRDGGRHRHDQQRQDRQGGRQDGRRHEHNQNQNQNQGQGQRQHHQRNPQQQQQNQQQADAARPTQTQQQPREHGEQREGREGRGRRRRRGGRDRHERQQAEGGDQQQHNGGQPQHNPRHQQGQRDHGRPSGNGHPNPLAEAERAHHAAALAAESADVVESAPAPVREEFRATPPSYERETVREFEPRETPAPVARPAGAGYTPAAPVKMEWPSDLQQVESDPAKISAAQPDVAQEQHAPRPRRTRRPAQAVSEEPLVQIETDRESSSAGGEKTPA